MKGSWLYCGECGCWQSKARNVPLTARSTLYNVMHRGHGLILLLVTACPTKEDDRIPGIFF